MDNDSKAQLLGTVGELCLPLVQTVLDQRMQRNIMEAQAEKEIQVAEAKTERMQQPQQPRQQAREDDTARQAREAAQGAGERQTIDDLKAETDCGICIQLLDAIADKEGQTRARALTEYGQFKSAIEDDADQETLEGVLQDTPTLRSILEEDLKMAAE